MNKTIEVITKDQLLLAYLGNAVVFKFNISTAAKGVGQQYGSEQTPLGRHIIRAKIGADVPAGTVFKGRRPTGELYSPMLDQSSPGRDWIITRIMWLSGLERGGNRSGNVDTMRRYIYIHGCPDNRFGDRPFTHGCIGMYCTDIIRLFDWSPVGTGVVIV